MFHRRAAARHGAPPALRRWFVRVLSPAPVVVGPVGEFPVEDEPVRPLPAGSMRQRPGGVFEDARLDAADRPTAPLVWYRPGEEIVTTTLAEGLRAGMRGRVSRVAWFRSERPVGVRMASPGWAPLVWFEPWEIESAAAVTLVLAAVDVLDDAPLMGGVR